MKVHSRKIRQIIKSELNESRVRRSSLYGRRHVSYDVGDIIAKREQPGRAILVLVEHVDPDVKNGRPGFEGTVVIFDPTTNSYTQTGDDTSGYNDQVIRIARRK